MKRKDYYSGGAAGDERGWDGACVACGHDYFECRGNCTCLSCNAQRQGEIRSGLWFDEDGGREATDPEYADAVSLDLIPDAGDGR